ncbi:MAG: DNA-directed RNA polymerase subunit alpha [Opitutae bacterium]|nr:DNA-directed RNA polymerase subunit alpha [Opitutae bacterium]|tara:strand:- start:778 stop:1914 length:1137 start_codon:yes stop_codon:yes gene_type:complete
MPKRLGQFVLPLKVVPDEKSRRFQRKAKKADITAKRAKKAGELIVGPHLGDVGVTLAEKEKESGDCVHAKFTASPFESGYGHTFGNSFRRVLLSSIEGAAISSIQIDGVEHEFQSLDGVIEDVSDIILNLKKILIVSHKEDKREPITLILEIEKEGEITAGDIRPDANVEIKNPDQVILTTDRKRRISAELQVTVGRGFCLGEDLKKEGQLIGIINVDALYSPVKLVKYSVEDARVGQMTDFDELILEISTDGRITPDDALKQSAAILRHHLDVFDQISDEEFEFESESKEISEQENRLRSLLTMSVNEIELSVRAANCLNNANITTVGELAQKSEQEMLKYRNFGKKSLNEIKAKLEQLGLSLGMKFDDRLLESGGD